MNCQHVLHKVGVDAVPLEPVDALHARLLYMVLHLLHQDGEGAEYRLEESVEVGEVQPPLPGHHGLALAVQVGQVVAHHPLLALPGHLLVAAGVEELSAADVLRLDLSNDPLHVVGDVALAQQLGRLLPVVLPGGQQEWLLEYFLVQVQIALLLVLLHAHQTLNDSVDGGIGLEVAAARGPALAVVLDPLQQLAHQVLLQRLDHLRLPDVEAELPDLLHLLSGLHGEGAVGQLRIAELLLLDVLGVEIQIQLVQIVDTAAELLPTVVITTKQIFLSGFSNFPEFLEN